MSAFWVYAEYEPPGMSRTSMSGAFANVWVGTTSCPKFGETKGFGSGFEDTGVLDSAKIESVMLFVRESTFRVLKGPNTSAVN